MLRLYFTYKLIYIQLATMKKVEESRISHATIKSNIYLHKVGKDKNRSEESFYSFDTVPKSRNLNLCFNKRGVGRNKVNFLL